MAETSAPELREERADHSIAADIPHAFHDATSPAPYQESRLFPSASSCPVCSAHSGGHGPASPVYAIGRIVPRYPSLAIEKEMAQAIGRAANAGLTDRQALHTALARPENRYLARQLCWVFSIEGLDTYILHPSDTTDFTLLIESLRADPSPMDMDVVIGLMGPVADPQLCNGLLVPIVRFDQIYSFNRDELIAAIPRPPRAPVRNAAKAAEELLDRIMQMADNAGSTADHRALNYLAVRYAAIYKAVGDAFNNNNALTSVEVRPSPLGGVRNVVDVVFAFTNRTSDVISKQYVTVDVTERFPFLVRKMSPYFDR